MEGKTLVLWLLSYRRRIVSIVGLSYKLFYFVFVRRTAFREYSVVVVGRAYRASVFGAVVFVLAGPRTMRFRAETAYSCSFAVTGLVSKLAAVTASGDVEAISDGASAVADDDGLAIFQNRCSHFRRHFEDYAVIVFWLIAEQNGEVSFILQRLLQPGVLL